MIESGVLITNHDDQVVYMILEYEGYFHVYLEYDDEEEPYRDYIIEGIIDMELGAAEVINDIKEYHKDYSEDELVELIKTWLETKTEHKATEATVKLYKDFEMGQLWDNEVPVFIGNEFVDEFEYKYKDLLLSIVAIFMLLDQDRRPYLIMDIAKNLQVLDKEIAEKFKDQIAERVYYGYVK